MARARPRGKGIEWDAGNKAARTLGIGADDYYICPLCVRGFTMAQLSCLTWDYVPPKSLGGRLKILICRECNSRAGHELDVHAKRAVQMQAFARGQGMEERRAKFVVDDLTANVNVEIQDNTWRISGIPKSNHPDTLPRLSDVFDKNYREGRGLPTSTLSFRVNFDPRRAEVSWLRSAYLAAFAIYGYRYALRPVMEIVRDQIAAADDKIMQRFSVRVTDADVAEDGMIQLEEPIWVQGIGVKMSDIFVFLPWEDGDIEFYERIASEGVNGRRVDFRGDGFTLPSRPVYLLDQVPAAT